MASLRGMGQTIASFRRAAERIKRVRERAPRETRPVLRMIGEEIMLDVKASRPGAGVPVDTGALRSTGTVEGPNTVGQVTLSFGGAAAPYALTQHEDLSYHHDTGEARYLVRGLERWQRNGASVAKALQELKEALFVWVMERGRLQALRRRR